MVYPQHTLCIRAVLTGYTIMPNKMYAYHLIFLRFLYSNALKRFQQL